MQYLNLFLEQAEYQLRKDIKVSENYLINNKEYIEELDKYILAAKIRIDEEQKDIDDQKMAIDETDLLQVQEVAIRESELDALINFHYFSLKSQYLQYLFQVQLQHQ